MRVIDSIVLHSSGAYDVKHNVVVHQSIDVIRQYHIAHNGWRDIGYHWYVEEDGRGLRGRHEDVVGSHVGGFNTNSLGLCVSGHGDFQPWNEAQMKESLRKCAEWCRRYHVPVERVVGHRETPSLGAPPVHKTCPGLLVDMDAFRAYLAHRLETSG